MKALPWRIVFAGVSYENDPVPNHAIDLMARFLVFTPSDRTDAFEALAHPYFDELRLKTTKLPHGDKLPPLFNFTDDEVKLAKTKKIYEKIKQKQ